MPDLKTLSALLHASLQSFKAYTAARDEIWTQVTVRELAARVPDLLRPKPCVQVSVKGSGNPDPNLRPALEKLYRQIQLQRLYPSDNAGMPGLADRGRVGIMECLER